MTENGYSSENNTLNQAVIFGAGLAGQRALLRLQTQYEILGFIDNSPQKQGTLVCGVPVWSVEQLAQQPNIEAIQILIASEFAEQIMQDLESKLMPSLNVRALNASEVAAFHFGDSLEIHKNALNVLKIVSNTLQRNGIEHHIDAGTLLGLYRDGALIPWDDDLDIAIDSKEISKLEACMASLLELLSEETDCQWESQTHLATTAFGNVPESVPRNIKLSPSHPTLPCLDFFIKYRSEEHCDYVLASRGIRMPSEPSRNRVKVQLANIEWWLPHKPEEYLSAHYGDWKTPRSDWSLSDLNNTKLF